MKSFFVFIVFVFSFCLPLSALGKIHIEPYGGYSFTFTNSSPLNIDALRNINKDTLDYISQSYLYSGLTGGVRLGYKSLIGLIAGVDVTLSQWRGLNVNEVMTPFTTGIFVSYHLPVLFRVYGSLMMIAPKTLLIDDQYLQNSFVLNCDKTKGLKIGVSYISIPFLSVNLEYQPLHISGSDSSSCNTSWSHTGAIYLNFTI